MIDEYPYDVEHLRSGEKGMNTNIGCSQVATTCNQLITGGCAKQDLLRRWDEVSANEAWEPVW